MSLDAIIRDVSSGTGSKVNTSGQVMVSGETDADTNPGNVMCVRMFTESDPGAVTGTAYLKGMRLLAIFV